MKFIKDHSMPTPHDRSLTWVLILAILAAFLPVFSQYGVALFMTISLVRWRHRIPAPLPCLRWLDLGVSCYALFMLGAAWLQVLGGSLSALAVAKFSLHFLLKNLLLWFVISRFFMLAVGMVHERVFARTFLVIALGHFFYLILQRYTGIDLSHGLTAHLPDYRFAHGVYRVSGFMGHPLTLSYNLVFLLLLALGLASQQARHCVLTAVVLLFSLLISGSRWPFIVAVLLIFLQLFQKRTLHRGQWAALLIFGSLLIFAEGSMLGRFLEIWQNPAGLLSGLDRLPYWRVHWQIFLDHPWIGVGIPGRDQFVEPYYRHFGLNDNIYIAHNIFLQTLADSGICGFVGLVGLIVSYGQSIRAVPAGSRGQHILISITAALLFGGLCQNLLRDSECLYCLWFVTSIGFASQMLEEKDHLERRASSRKDAPDI